MKLRHRPPETVIAAPVEPAANAVERLAERALTAATARAVARTDALTRAKSGGSPADVITRLERRYTRSVATTSALVGLSAAVPGVGTIVAVVLTGVNAVGFLTQSTTFVSAVAQVHGVHIDDLPRRRTLLLASLLGADGARAVRGKLGPSSLYWGRGLLTRLPLGTVRTVNRRLVRTVVGTTGAKGSTLLLGRLAPFGVGAVIGWFAGRALSRQVIAGAHGAFGPPPERDPDHPAARV